MRHDRFEVLQRYTRPHIGITIPWSWTNSRIYLICNFSIQGGVLVVALSADDSQGDGVLGETKNRPKRPQSHLKSSEDAWK